MSLHFTKTQVKILELAAKLKSQVIQRPMQTRNTEENQEFTQFDDDAVVMYPHIEQNIPIPKSARDALPVLNNEEELEMLANTIKLISDLSGEPIQATQEDINEAKTVAEAMIKNPENKLQLKKYKNSTLAQIGRAHV